MDSLVCISNGTFGAKHLYAAVDLERDFSARSLGELCHQGRELGHRAIKFEHGIAITRLNIKVCFVELARLNYICGKGHIKVTLLAKILYMQKGLCVTSMFIDLSVRSALTRFSAKTVTMF